MFTAAPATCLLACLLALLACPLSPSALGLSYFPSVCMQSLTCQSPVPSVPLSPLLQACWTSGLSFSIGAIVPLLAGAFIPQWQLRIASVCIVTVVMLIAIGALGAHLGGARHLKGAVRVLIGGSVAMAVT